MCYFVQDRNEVDLSFISHRYWTDLTSCLFVSVQEECVCMRASQAGVIRTKEEI